MRRCLARYLEPRARLEVPGFPIRAEVMPANRGGKVLVTSARSAQLTIIDPAGPAVERTLPIGLKATSGTVLGNETGESSVPIGIEIDPAGERVWIAHAAADTVQELDTASWKQTRLLKTGDEPDAMAYSARSVTGPGEEE